MVRNKQKIFRNMAKYFRKKDPPEDNEKFKNEKDKFKKYFNENL